MCVLCVVFFIVIIFKKDFYPLFPFFLNMGLSYSKTVKSAHFDGFFETLPSMVGKRVLITGTTTGIGNVVAKSIATLGGNLVLLNRKSERADNSIAQLKSDFPDIEITSIECDLTSFSSVRKAADDYKKLFGGQGLDVLANNAGIMAFDDVATGDGFDIQMQTNYLSHFLLTRELMPELEISAKKHGESRVINHSSGSRKRPMKPLDEDYLSSNGGNLGGNGITAKYTRYQQTKLAQVVFSYALHDKLQSTNSLVKAISVHPGITATGLQQSTSKYGGRWFLEVVMLMAQSAEDGAMPLLKACCHPEVKSRDFWGPKGNGLWGPVDKFEPEEISTEQRAKDLIWTASEKATGCTFNL